MGPDIFDLIIVLTLAYFAYAGFRLGLIRGVASIVGLLCAFWATCAWNSHLLPYLGFIANPTWRLIASCVIIFIAVMLAVGLIARLLHKVVTYSFAGWVDKIGGLLMGLAEGVLIWGLIIFVLERLFGDASFLRDSRALPYFQVIIDQVRTLLPPDLAQQLGF